MQHKIKQICKKIVDSNWLSFLIGLLVGVGLFGFFYGWSAVNPFNSDWIWHGVTHDTAQHFMGWEFYRSSNGSPIVDKLAYPHGLSIVFMDVIPLLALLFRPLANILPAGFQYFGLWGVLCYGLMGGLAAVLVRQLINRLRRLNSLSSVVKLLAIIAIAGLFVLSPMMMARNFYHPALAGQWIILLGFLLIFNTNQIKSNVRFIASWSLAMVLAVLIHPYFLPMTGALLLISVIWRRWHTDVFWQCWAFRLFSVIVPVLCAGLVFWQIGGFSIGSGAEVYDLHEKGFNLLSFFNPMGYSILPAFANASTSPETMMWLGLGAIGCLIFGLIIGMMQLPELYRAVAARVSGYGNKILLSVIVLLSLLVFAIGVRVDFGSITLFSYSVPQRIYEVWSAFRAAAREAWPFYYATLLLVPMGTMWLICGYGRHNWRRINYLLAGCLVVLLGVQFIDRAYSSAGKEKRAAYKNIANQPVEFSPLTLNNDMKKRQHLVALDSSFRGDQSGSYIIGRTALQYNMSLNLGFFARVPEQVFAEQANWRIILTAKKLAHKSDLKQIIFFTSDPNFVKNINDEITVVHVDRWWFIYLK